MRKATYEILIDDCVVAKEVEIGDAMIFIKALFEAYYNSHEMEITIKKHAEEEKINDT